MATEKERRIQNLLMVCMGRGNSLHVRSNSWFFVSQARHRYSQFTKEKAIVGKKGSDEVKNAVNLQKKDIEGIEEELAKCRLMHELIMKDIGKAHRSAKVEDRKESEHKRLARVKEEKVRSRAKAVLLEEIQRIKTSELKKKLQKEITSQRRRDLFGTKCSRLKSKPTQEYTLEDCVLIEEVLSSELKRLLEEKAREKQSSPIVQAAARKDVSTRRETPRRSIEIQTDPVRESVQVQTEILKEPPRPSIQEVEDVLGLRISRIRQGIITRKKNFASKSTRPVVFADAAPSNLSSAKASLSSPLFPPRVSVPKLKETATNTTACPLVDLKSDETHYLSLPNYISRDKIDLDDSASSIINVSEISEMSEINLRDLISQIKSIRSLIDEQKNALPKEIVPSKAEIDFRNRLNQTYCKKVLRNSKTHLTISPSTMSISGSSEETAKNADAASFTVSLDDDTQDIQTSRYEVDSDTSLSSVSQSQSFQPSIGFTNFSRMIHVDKEIFWKEVLDQAGVKASALLQPLTHGVKGTPRRTTSMRDFRFHSTPITHNYRLART